MMQKLRFVFLLASERSGSNLISAFLDANSSICAPPPVHLIRTMLANRHRYGNLELDANWNDFIKDSIDLHINQLSAWNTSWTEEIIKTTVQNRSLASIVRAFYELEASYKGAILIFIKENETHMLVPFIEQAFPGSRYIWLVRDPRDMAASHVTTPGRSGGVVEASRRWLFEQRGTRLAMNALTDHDPSKNKYTVIRFEDLVTEPEIVAREVCSFVEVPFDQRMLEFNKESQAIIRSESTVLWNNLKEPMLKHRIGRFNKDLSEEEIRYVEALCAQEMEYHGYRIKYSLIDSRELLNHPKPVHYLRTTASEHRSAEEKEKRAIIKAIKSRIEERNFTA